ncbi:MAG: Formiminotransferase-cyclodeaminase [Solirubrobacteraceae bacterium]|jgi:formiminotetrahydrofolate cyclodeaminase|nr:Formiminotransferase-cyclodeaminase [Solirubrobacteraceae bacterium]
MSDGELLGVSVEDLLDRLASERLGTGGSAACAICAAMAAGLVAMVARRAGEHWPGSGAAVAQAESLRARVAPMAQGTAEAYARAVAALERAASDGDERAHAQLGPALDDAALAPLLIAESAADVAGLAAVVAASCRPEHAADAAAAAALAAGAAQAAAHYVLINLATTADDAFAERARGAEQEARAASARALTASGGG